MTKPPINVPLMSKAEFLMVTEILTGEAPKADAAGKACIRCAWLGGLAFGIYGYGNKAEYECNISKEGPKGCFPTDKSTNKEWAAKFSKT